MTKFYKQIGLTLALMLFLGAGCSSKLQVTVHVLDRDYWNHTPALVAEQVQLIESRVLEQRGANAFRKISQDIDDVMSVLFDSLAAAGEVDRSDIPAFLENISVNTNRQLATADSLYDQGLRQTTRARQSNSSSDERGLYLAAKGNFAAGDSVLATLARNVNQEFDSWLQDSAESLSASFVGLITTASREIIVPEAFSTRDSHLLDDVLAPLVINAPDNYWEGTFNDTYAKTRFGNSDIAIVMESLGEYTIKGVRLDASKVTEATFKTLSQSIQFVASASGRPYSRNNEANEATGDGTEMRLAEERQQEAETLQRLSRLSSVALLDAILNNRTAWAEDVDPEDLKTAVTTLKNTFSVYRAQLNPEIEGEQK